MSFFKVSHNLKKKFAKYRVSLKWRHDIQQNDIHHNDTQHFINKGTGCNMSAVLSVVMLNFFMLVVIVVNVFLLNVIMLSAVAPLKAMKKLFRNTEKKLRRFYKTFERLTN